MPDFPYLRPAQAQDAALTVFSGLDRRNGAKDGALRAGRNIDPGGFPWLVPARPRAQQRALTRATDLIAACGGLGWIADGTFYWNGDRRGGVDDGRHQMAAIGHNVVIFPEKLYLDTTGTGALQSMEARQAGRLVFTDSTITFESAAVFRVGDGIAITGCTARPENNKTAVVREVSGKTLTFSADCFTAGTETLAVVRREVPDLQFVCEKDNRLWGVTDGKICCSVLGDPFNWRVYDGLAGDGWEVSVGTGGDFTGCAAAASHLLFFKEDCVHKVYGVKPANFQVQVSRIPGVRAGCERSILNVGETIYWWARDGLMAYGGGIPDRLSAPLGETPYTEVAAGADGHTLYLSGKRDGAAELLALDLETGAFAPCDEVHALAFAAEKDGLCYLTEAGLWRVGQGDTPVQWEATFGPFAEMRDMPPLLSRLTLRVDTGSACSLSAAVSDAHGGWEPVWAGEVLTGGTVRIPIALRGDWSAVRLSGTGRVRLQALIRREKPGGGWQ